MGIVGPWWPIPTAAIKHRVLDGGPFEPVLGFGEAVQIKIGRILFCIGNLAQPNKNKNYNFSIYYYFKII